MPLGQRENAALSKLRRNGRLAFTIVELLGEHLVFWSVDMKEFIGFPVVPVSRPFLTSWIHESVASLAFDSSASRV